MYKCVYIFGNLYFNLFYVVFLYSMKAQINTLCTQLKLTQHNTYTEMTYSGKGSNQILYFRQSSYATCKNTVTNKSFIYYYVKVVTLAMTGMQ